MANFYVDSSALVKRYRHEEGSDTVLRLLESAERLVIARLSIVEVSSALTRRARQTATPAEELTATLGVLDAELRDSFDIVELDEAVMERAMALARKHALRGADAIQLACALMAYEDSPDAAFLFMSSDVELNAAAIAEGLPVENPANQPD
jgi:predicted nucleic acid-binding protein